MVIRIGQKISRHLLVLGSHVKRNTISLGIPIGTPPVFFSGKSLGSNIQTFILSKIGLVQLKNIETDSLLRLDVTFDRNICSFPDPAPGLFLKLQQLIK